MHLGMTGPLHGGLAAGTEAAAPGDFHHEAGGIPAHDHVVFHLSNGVTHHLQRRAPLRLHDAGTARPSLPPIPCSATSGIEPLGNALDGEVLAATLRRQDDAAQGRAARPAARRGSRQHLCLRGAAPGPASRRAGRPARWRARTAAAGAAAIRLAGVIREVLEEAVAAGGSTLRDYAHTDGSLGYFQHTFRVYDREGEPCPTPGLQGRGAAPRPVRPLDLLLRRVPALRFRQHGGGPP